MFLSLLFAVCFAVCCWFIYKVWTFVPWKPADKRKRSLGHQKWDERKLPDRIDAIVIGSGMGGLSCAAVLGTAGKHVVVFEQHEVLGGGTHCFHVDGKAKWKFDSGLHYTIPLSQQMLQVACGASEPPVLFPRMGEPSDAAYDRVKLSGLDSEFRIINDKQMKKQLKGMFPKHHAEIDAFYFKARQVNMLFPFWMLTVFMPTWVKRWFMNSWFMTPWRQWASKTAQAGIEDIIPGKDEQSNKLKALLSGLFLDSGGVPTSMSFFMTSAVNVGFPFVGGAYPLGGPEEMNLNLCEAIESHGGQVFVKTPVTKIVTDENHAVTGVELFDGTIVECKTVISATGFRNTFNNLVPRTACQHFNIDTKDLKLAQAAGFLMANVAINGTAEELQIECSNLWPMPASERNNFDMFQGIEDFFADPLGVPAADIPLMITFPSVKDRRFAAEKGKYQTCQVLAMAKFEWFSKYQGDNPWARNAPPNVERNFQDEYDAYKQKWADRCVEALLIHYPQFKDRIEFVNLSTPLTIDHYLQSTHGSAVGLDVTPTRFTDLETMDQLDMKSKIPGLWLTGHDVLMCGVPLAQLSGIFTACRILGFFRSLEFSVCSLKLLVTSFVRSFFVKPLPQ